MTLTQPRVMLYVQHLMGIGHQRRAAVIARALGAAGAHVSYVSGGVPVPALDVGGADFIQLPPARAADLRYRELVDARGAPVDESWREARRAELLEVFDAARPHALLIETFPFGRRLLRFELLPLLDHARSRRPRPIIMSSVRDILQPRSDPDRYREMAALALRYFDLVLVHGDPAIVTLGATFPEAAVIEDRLRYTGYVVEPGQPGDAEGSAGAGEVLVSAGGGVVGERLLRIAMAARGKSSLGESSWRILVGHDIGAEVFRDLRAAADAGVRVERNRADFPAMLGRCRVSVSQAGYNTVAEVLRARAAAVLVPFEAHGECEQAIRAGLLHRRRLVQVVPQAELTPARLARAVEAAARGGASTAAGIDFAGAQRTAELILAAIAERSYPIDVKTC